MEPAFVRILNILPAFRRKKGLLWIWLIVLFLMPLFPLTSFVGHQHWDAIRWIPFQDFSLTLNSLLDIIGNIGWFMLYGFLLHFWMDENSSPFRSTMTVVMIAAGVSLALEFFQVFCHNRIPSMTDVICDTAGAGLGAYFSEQYRSAVAQESIRHRVIEGSDSRPPL